MCKIKPFALLFLTTIYCFSQTVNEYKAVIIPLKFSFQKLENQYRLQTASKRNLQNSGFTAYYVTEEIIGEFFNRCSVLNLEVESENSFLVTKLAIVFKDCNGNIIYKSPFGKSRQKEFDLAYMEALNDAFKYVTELNYKCSVNREFLAKQKATLVNDTVTGTSSVNVTTISKEKNATQTNANIYDAMPTAYGYKLLDSTKKWTIKAYRTSNPTNFIAKKDAIQGTLISKENQWYFEYYENDQFFSEKIDVKF